MTLKLKELVKTFMLMTHKNLENLKRQWERYVCAAAGCLCLWDAMDISQTWCKQNQFHLP